jgi:LDH2 family malate/lactate/ureidoglycolate dehydrogenase
MTETSVSAAKLTGFAAACLEKLGLAAADAGLVAETLVESNLRGVDSHGVVRLPHYAKRLRNGTVNPRPKLSVQRTGGFDRGGRRRPRMGQLVAVRAMQEAISLARRERRRRGSGDATARTAAPCAYSSSSRRARGWAAWRSPTPTRSWCRRA